VIYDARYVRVAVRNKGLAVAKDCRAYLTDIEKRNAAGHYESVGYYRDSLRLRWAYEVQDPDAHAGVDIPQGLHVHFDVMATKDEHTVPDDVGGLRIIEVAYKGLRHDRGRLMNKLKFNAEYRFNILVVADGASPLPLAVRVDLGRKWDEVSAFFD
jgi:hypothetical protein